MNAYNDLQTKEGRLTISKSSRIILAGLAVLGGYYAFMGVSILFGLYQIAMPN